MKKWKAELMLAVVTLIWGGTFLFTKQGLNDCPPSLYLILRFSIALSVSIVFFHKHLQKIDRKTLTHGLILGVLFGAGFVLQTYGLKFTAVSKSAFITGLTVPLTPFAYWFVQRKVIGTWPKVAVVVASFGMWLFTGANISEFNTGDLLTIFSTAFWAFYITYMDKFTHGKDSFSHTSQLVMMQFVGALPIAALSFVFMEMENFSFTLSTSLIVSLAYNSLLASFILTFIHTFAQRYTTPVKAALIFSLEPLFASTFAYLAINETLTIREMAGGAVLLSAVIVSELGSLIGKGREIINMQRN